MIEANIPEELQDLYRKAYASFDQVEDRALQHALIALMRAIYHDAASTNRSQDQIANSLTIT